MSICKLDLYRTADQITNNSSIHNLKLQIHHTHIYLVSRRFINAEYDLSSAAISMTPADEEMLQQL